jgi:hypothetical protein
MVDQTADNLPLLQLVEKSVEKSVEMQDSTLGCQRLMAEKVV